MLVATLKQTHNMGHAIVRYGSASLCLSLMEIILDPFEFRLLPEVLDRLGNSVSKKAHRNAPPWLTRDADVEEHPVRHLHTTIAPSPITRLHHRQNINKGGGPTAFTAAARNPLSTCPPSAVESKQRARSGFLLTRAGQTNSPPVNYFCSATKVVANSARPCIIEHNFHGMVQQYYSSFIPGIRARVNKNASFLGLG